MDVSAAQRGRPRWASAGAVPGQGPRGQGREMAASPSARLSARPAPHCEGGDGVRPGPRGLRPPRRLPPQRRSSSDGQRTVGA